MRTSGYLTSSPLSPISANNNYRNYRSLTSPSTLVPSKPPRSPSPHKGPRPRTTLPNPISFYFDVSDSYVATKLKMILLPFLHLDWMPSLDDTDRPASPRYNKVAADLYLPSMGLITYLLVVMTYGDAHGQTGLTAGTEALIKLCTVSVIELMIESAGLYWLYVPPPQLIELLAYSLYKVIPALCILLTLEVFGKEVFYASFAFFSLMHAVFMSQAWRQFVKHGDVGSVHQEETMRRTGFLYMVSFAQLLFIHILTSN